MERPLLAGIEGGPRTAITLPPYLIRRTRPGDTSTLAHAEPREYMPDRTKKWRRKHSACGAMA
ncbi:hypothetical protein [Burkholderia ubonensis]|uniref:hypothetical protein n=1 Tax=Burkholderia ubonensis TaxID=101571 RepID=UPI0012FAF51E|nr:hypothetical protein [Burkholderia ubonensis]